MLTLDTPISEIPGVGPWVKNKLSRLTIHSIKDLLWHFPTRYQEYLPTSDITRIQPGETVTIHGQILSLQNVYLRTGRKIQKAVVSDGTAEIEVTWFNQPYLIKTLPIGTWVSLSGKVKLFGRKGTLVAPEYEKLASQVFDSEVTQTRGGPALLGQQTKDTMLHTGRLVPIYPETAGLSSKWLRAKIATTLPSVKNQIEDYLPGPIKTKYKLIDLPVAIEWIHFPDSQDRTSAARRRLSFDEFLKIQLNAIWRKAKWQQIKVSHPLVVDSSKVASFIRFLPFNLTKAQKRSTREILLDLQKETAMNRLLQGDVGSGKTVVAAIACFIAWTNGFQSAIMAPTQILANQHFLTLQKLLSPFDLKIGLKTQNKRLNPQEKYDILVGTQALIQKNLDFTHLALVIIDEQHRFGVVQRALLARKAISRAPHILTMTATPIPRTVALTLYGDLDLSILDEMPIGRLKVKTWVVPAKKREAAYLWIRTKVKDTNQQAFIVCPLIEESQIETMLSVRAATAEFKRLAKEVFPDLKLGLLHGRLRARQKDEVMQDFKSGKLDILVATPVVEVGIDIPTATIMLIEASERFGLAQLHQLRGRVGRANMQSYCLLFTDSRSRPVYSRLKALETIYSGEKLAELDLKLRGPGEIFGKAQHGFQRLKIGSLAQIVTIILARLVAKELMTKIDSNPAVKNLINHDLEISPN